MHHIVPVLSGDNAVVKTAEASVTLSRVEDILDRDEDAFVVLDFTGIGRLSHDAIDALMAPLFERLGEALPERVFFDGCAASVLADLREIAEAGAAVSTHMPDRGATHGRQAA